MTTHPLRNLRAACVAAALATSVVIPVASAHGATPADGGSTCAQQGTLPLEGGAYTLQANEWNSSSPQCVTATSGTAWSVTTADFDLPTNGAPATYPSLYQGCHWGACTTGSTLPIQVNDLGSATSSWSTNQPESGAYDVAYDLWTNSTPTTSGQPDGTEIMIWLNSRGGVEPFGAKTGTSTAAGHNWDVWTGQQTSWKIISYVLQGGGTSFSGLDIKALLDDAVSRGSLDPSTYLIDAEAGFEIWQGGQGLGTNSFSFSATAANGGGTGGGTGGTGGTGGGTGGGGTGSTGCTATYAVTNDWSTGFTGDVTVTNTGSSPTKGWTVKWNWPGDQTVTNSWNAVTTQSGQTVTAANQSYDNAVPAGGSTTFGFQAGYSGTNAAPTLTCQAD
ncbi:cellulose binding domain-containing protein [Streptomyces sp. PTM05]|uniref:Cellulose binding domain-containing protein n=1 Tax=Streptantibioticus parmotrematis TaxID=2873249 RepID=A0ABS7QUE7_9ACTN|nr:cellulose binding domain-containing protein [Streptantibioticus parmotrematis]MBY8885437.1 cellulose binding domain-containing protein [Streptantibioticus parmotrematis]